MVQRNLLILALGCAAIALGDGVPGNAALAATTVTISAKDALQVGETSISTGPASGSARASGSGKDHVLLAQAGSGDSPGNSGNAGGGGGPGNSGNAGGGNASGAGGSSSGSNAGSGSGVSEEGEGNSDSGGAPGGAGTSGAGQGGTGPSGGSSGNTGGGGGNSAGSGAGNSVGTGGSGNTGAASGSDDTTAAPGSGVGAPAPTATSDNAPSPAQAAPPAAPAPVDPATVGSISGDAALPSAIAPSESRNDSSLYRGHQALQAVTQPLPFAPGTPREIVAACRDSIIAVARAHGVIHVDASSIGRMEQRRNGEWVAPLEVRIVYARQGGSEVKQAPVSCRLSGNGNVVSLR